MNRNFDREKRWDWIVWCDICGTRCWGSEATKLSTYTGRGGAIVCPDCNDPIDYGIVPYSIPAEKPVPFVRDASQANDPNAIFTLYGTFPIDQFDPWTNPNLILASTQRWEALTAITWDMWNLAWETTPLEF